MGAWGHRPFDNDSARDWLAEHAGLDAEETIRGALTAVQELDYVDVDEGSAAVAAAAVLAAAMRGDPLPGPKSASRMAEALRASAELRQLAVRALDLVLGERSELAELWGAGEWRDETTALRDALERG